MTDIIVDRTSHIVMNPIYDTIATWLLIIGLSLFIILTLIAYHIRRNNWLDTKFDRRLIINVFCMAVIIITAITLYNYKEYEHIEENITYKGTVKDIGSNYITLDNGKKGQLFYDSTLKGVKSIPKAKRIDSKSIKKGDDVVVTTKEMYTNISELGTRADYAPDNTYDIIDIKRKDS